MDLLEVLFIYFCYWMRDLKVELGVWKNVKIDYYKICIDKY